MPKKFYHFTSVALAESILSSSISQGHLALPNRPVRYNVVWLTSDPNPWGHGLTTGKERLTQSEIAFSEKIQGAPLKNTVTVDKTRIRIAIELDPQLDPTLISFNAYCKQNDAKLEGRLLGLSALERLDELSPKEIHKLMRSAHTKESTWWLKFAPVEPSCFAGVDVNHGGRYVPYVFEAHGRAEMLACGFAVPSTHALSELANITPPAHRFETTKALVLCTSPRDEPMVCIRGNLKDRVFEIESAAPQSPVDEATPRLQRWIADFRDELRECWQEAVTSYHTYYPQEV